MPPAKYPRMSPTLMRVPRMQGFPNRTDGSTLMRSSRLMDSSLRQPKEYAKANFSSAQRLDVQPRAAREPTSEKLQPLRAARRLQRFGQPVARGGALSAKKLSEFSP